MSRVSRSPSQEHPLTFWVDDGEIGCWPAARPMGNSSDFDRSRAWTREGIPIGRSWSEVERMFGSSSGNFIPNCLHRSKRHPRQLWRSSVNTTDYFLGTVTELTWIDDAFPMAFPAYEWTIRGHSSLVELRTRSNNNLVSVSRNGLTGKIPLHSAHISRVQYRWDKAANHSFLSECWTKQRKVRTRKERTRTNLIFSHWESVKEIEICIEFSDRRVLSLVLIGKLRKFYENPENPGTNTSNCFLLFIGSKSFVK